MGKLYIFLILLWITFISSVISTPSPPSPAKAALMARYIIHKTDWVSLATISTIPAVQNYPFVSLKSSSDGPKEEGTGVPYLYMTSMDVSGKDVEENNNVTIMATLAETQYCEENEYDPQDPRCAKLIISGKLVKVDNYTAEYEFAKESLYERHPSMKYWPANHNFYVAKIDIEQIAVLDFFGGIKYVSKRDYFNPPKKPFVKKVDVIILEV